MISFDDLFDKAVEVPNRAVSGSFRVQKYVVSITIMNWTIAMLYIHIGAAKLIERPNKLLKEDVKELILKGINIHVQCDNIPLLYPNILTAESHYPELIKNTLMWCKEETTNNNEENLFILTRILAVKENHIATSYLKTCVLERIRELRFRYSCSMKL